MKISLFKWLCVVTALLGSLRVGAQVRISFQVKNAAAAPIEAAMITVFDKDTLAYIDFVMTDSLGKAALILKKSGIYCISANSLGYEMQYKTVDVQKQAIQLDFVLAENAINIAEVVVEARKMAIMVKGDTILYDLKQFTNGTEDKLSDVLKKLPGIEYDKNGDIMYRGEKVDNILLENRNILGKMHKAVSEGLNAKDLSTIKIHQNETEQQGKNTVMDVLLKAQRKNRWNGNLSLAGGLEEKWRSEFTFYKVKPRSGTTLFGKIDYSGQDILTASEYLGLTPTLDFSKLTSNPNEFAQNISEFNIKKEGLQSNRDYFLNFNHEQSIGSNKKLNLSHSLFSLDRTNEYSFLQTYINNNNTYIGKTQEQQNRVGTLNSLLFKSPIGVLDLFVSYKVVSDELLQKGFFNIQAFDAKQQSKEKTLEIHQKFTSKTLNKHENRSLTLKQSIDFKNEAKQINLRDSFPLFNSQQRAMNFLQKKLDFTLNQQLSYAIPLRNTTLETYIKASYHYELQRQEEQESTQTSDMNFQEYSTAIGFQCYNLAHKGMKLGSAQSLHLMYRKLPSQTHLLPKLQHYLSLSFRLKKDKPWQVSINQKIENSYSQLQHFLGFPYLENMQMLSESNIKVNHNTWEMKHFLNFNNTLQKVSTDLLFVILSHGYQKNPIQSALQVQNNYLVQKYFIAPNVNSLEMSVFAKKKLTKTGIQYTCNMRGIYADTWTLKDASIINAENAMLNIENKWSRALNEHFDVRLNYGFGANWQRSSVATLNSQHHTAGISLEYRLFKKVTFSHDFSAHQMKTKAIKNTNYLLDSDIKYHIKNFKVFLQGKNLLNLVPIQQNSISITANGITIKDYETYPGIILLGLEYKL